MRKYLGTVLGEDNLQPVEGASITIYPTGTLTKAILYSNDGVIQTTNPVASNSDGDFYFYISNGRYDLVASGPGITTKILTDIMIVDDLIGYDKTYPFEIRDSHPDTAGWGNAERGRTWAIRDVGDGTLRTYQWSGAEILIL
jgi:hypothetical protein